MSVDTDSDGVWEFESGTETEFLVDASNFTGYHQVLVEKTWSVDAAGTRTALTKQTTYTLGHDVISQTEWDPATGLPGETYVLLYDGHGSTRALADATGQIAHNAAGLPQVYHYDAYGVGLGFTESSAQTSLLYSGEQFDQRVQMQYLRARYYNQAAGNFNRLDPYFGNIQEPRTLHKYLYAAADPISFADPTGNSPSTLGALGALSGISGLAGLSFNAVANYSLNRPLLEGAGWAFAGGAVLGPLAAFSPAAGIVLAGLGFAASASLSWEVVTDPNSTPGQIGASLSLVALSAFGGYRAFQVGRANGWLINSKFLDPSGASRLNRAVELIRSRVQEMKTQLGSSEGWVTMAVTVARDTLGRIRVIVSTSEPNGTIRPGVRIGPNEVVVPGSNHAEVNGVTYAVSQGWEVISTGATRPICGGCITALTTWHPTVVPAVPLRYNRISIAKIKNLGD